MPLLGAFIVPHPPIIIEEIGKGEQLKIQKTIDSYNEIAVMIAKLKPDTIIISSPHLTSYTDYFHISPGSIAYGDFRQFGAGNLMINTHYDQDLTREIIKMASSDAIHIDSLNEKEKKLDHGVMVPLHFINKYYSDYKIVRLGLSNLPRITHYQLGISIQKVISESNKKIVFLASGDLSHKLKTNGPYGYAKEGEIFDQEVINCIKTADFYRLLTLDEIMCEKAMECGLNSIIILAGIFDGYNAQTNILSYENDFGVGYLIAAINSNGYDEKRCFYLMYLENQRIKTLKTREFEDEYVRLARMSLEYYIKNGKKMTCPLDLSKELSENIAGVFVSLKINNLLRGCIGTIAPYHECVALEIIDNAISAGVNDYRFNKVEIDELDSIIYSVDVLGKQELISSISELDVKKYGVIVEAKGKKGLLLPNIEGVETISEQIDIALNKANISLKEKYQIYRFSVIRHH